MREKHEISYQFNLEFSDEHETLFDKHLEWCILCGFYQAIGKFWLICFDM